MKKISIAFAISLLATTASASALMDQCVVAKAKQTKAALVLVKPVPVAMQYNGDIAGNLIDTTPFFVSAVRADKIQLTWAPGFAGDQPLAGKVLGWVKASDMEVQNRNSCE